MLLIYIKRYKDKEIVLNYPLYITQLIKFKEVFIRKILFLIHGSEQEKTSCYDVEFGNENVFS